MSFNDAIENTPLLQNAMENGLKALVLIVVKLNLVIPENVKVVLI